ncbi:MAG: hypothetical protein ACOYOA_01415 [Saprospiraceae bacterium]
MQIHVIAFDIPYPADYGGVIDVFYKLKALKSLSFKVILHCFQYGGKEEAPALEGLAEQIYYYKRSRSLLYQFYPCPFIISTRNSSELLFNLKKDDFPILFEGIHSTFWISNEALSSRKKIVRMHNIEWQYYARLASLEKNFFRKLFLKLESIKLLKYEQFLIKQKNVELMCISDSDYQYYKGLGWEKVTVVSAFHPFDEVKSKQGLGKYILFHGNLGIADNEKAAILLIEKVFSKNPYAVLIAGKRPSHRLYSAAKTYQNISIVANPDHEQMHEILRDAHIHILWSFQPEGVKLKLYYAVFEGRFVVANKAITQNSELRQFVTAVENATEIADVVHKLFSQVFDNELISTRSSFLRKLNELQIKALFENLTKV